MKTTTLIAAALIALMPAALPQGDLIPPGPPGPMMKTLDQVEPRVIVNAANTPGDWTNTFIISAPGSYYFTSNLTGEPGKHRISIQTNDVTLDLNGFALIRPSAAAVARSAALTSRLRKQITASGMGASAPGPMSRQGVPEQRAFAVRECYQHKEVALIIPRGAPSGRQT